MNDVKEKWFINQVLDALSHTKLQIHPYAILILITIAKYADKNGDAYPSVKQIEQITQIRNDHSHIYFKMLSELKIMKTKRQYDKRLKVTRNFYKINISSIIEIRQVGDEFVAKLLSDGNVDLIPLNERKLNQTPEQSLVQFLNQTPEQRIAHPTQTPERSLRSYIELPNSKDITTQPIAHDNPPMVNNLSLCAFDRFWVLYPRKQDKVRAKKTWERKKLDEFIDIIEKDLKARIENDVQWQNKEFIPYPNSYINGERWNDEIIEEKPNVTKSRSGAANENSRLERTTRAFEKYEEERRRNSS